MRPLHTHVVSILAGSLTASVIMVGTFSDPAETQPVPAPVAAERIERALDRTEPVTRSLDRAMAVEIRRQAAAEKRRLARQAEKRRLAREARRAEARRQAEAEAAAAAAQVAEEESTTAAAEPAAPSAPVSLDGNRALGRRLMLEFGFGADQWPALETLWTRESGWNHTAANPSSSAYGIPQALPGSKMASAGADWATNPATQIRWGLGYIRDRYGSPSAALAHSNSVGWY